VRAVRVILAEDSVLLREGLARLLLDEGHEVIASVDRSDALLEAVEQTPPELAVIDVRMPPTHTDEGLCAALEIRRRWPAVAVLVLSQYVERRYTTELITSSSGGIGYLLKDRVAHVEDFLDAIDRLADGGTAFDPEVVRQLLSRTTRTNPIGRLSPREREVLELMAQGHINAAIGARLGISQSAVEKHVNAIFDALDLRPADTGGYSRRVLAILRFLND
jgi:DNA-binding NarL/FixJ family response regulator